MYKVAYRQLPIYQRDERVVLGILFEVIFDMGPTKK